MKRGTIDHPKVAMLSGLLKVRLLEAVGVLESLWHWSARFTPPGDIGRCGDDVIASGVRWHGRPDALIRAMIDAKGCGQFGWIEPNDTYRLVIHDWHEHADESVQKWLANHSQTFWNGREPFSKRSRISRERVATISPQPSLAKPSLANNSIVSFNDSEGILSGATLPEPFDRADVKAALLSWIRHLRSIGKGGTDPADTAVRLTRICRSPEMLLHTIDVAIAGQWKSITNPVEPAAHPQSSPDLPRMFE